MSVERHKFPYLPVDVDRLTSDELVEAMSTEEFGAYFLLLCKAWKAEPPCSVPNDDQTLSKWARVDIKKWLKIRTRVMSPWKQGDDGRFYQKRLLVVYQDVMAKVNQKKEAGAKGGKAKASKQNAKTLENEDEMSSGARATLEHRYDFATSGTLAEAWRNSSKEKDKDKVNTSGVPEVNPLIPFSDFVGCNEDLRTLDCRDGTVVTYEQNPIVWEFEFISAWNKLPDVTVHSLKALADIERRMLIDRFREHDWDWKQAMQLFPVNWQSIPLIQFLKKDFVQSILCGDRRIPDFAKPGASKKPAVDVHAGIKAVLEQERLKREKQMSEFGTVFDSGGDDNFRMPATNAG